MIAVTEERSNWRDEMISKRHRMWGFNCPAVDIDFLAMEYSVAKPVALVEYKHFNARQPDYQHPSYRAFRDLCDNYKFGPLPFVVVFYWPDCWAFRAVPQNTAAAEHFDEAETMCEFDYVAKLYRLRRLVVARELEGRLSHALPGASEAA